MNRAVPTLPTERIVTLDIIRGFALLGILVVNMASFSGAGLEQPTSLPDQVAVFIVNVLFSGKFNSLCSLLFAIGFTIQLERLEQRAGNDARSRTGRWSTSGASRATGGRRWPSRSKQWAARASRSRVPAHRAKRRLERCIK